MEVKRLVTVLNVIAVFVAGCQISCGEGSIHGDQKRLYQAEYSNHMGRTTQNTSLFSNIAKELADMIRDVFNKTNLKNVTKACIIGKEIEVEDTTDNNKDVTRHFRLMARHYYEYEADLRLTRDRATFSVSGKKHEGGVSNALQWSNSIKELRKMLFDLINEAIEMVKAMPRNTKRKKLTKAERQRQQKKVNKHQNNLSKLLQSIKERTDQIIDEKEYVNQDAKSDFMNKEHDPKRIAEMKAVEEHILLALRRLPKRFRQWAIEAANFYIKKLR